MTDSEYRELTAGVITLAGFLRARFDEDAHAASRAAGTVWEASSDSGHAWRFRAPGVYIVDEDQAEGRWRCVAEVRDQDDQVHIARHDPARVLAEVEAKRRIVDHVLTWEHDNPDEGGYHACPAVRTEPLGDLPYGEAECTCGLRLRQGAILRTLAAVYVPVIFCAPGPSDHPGTIGP